MTLFYTLLNLCPISDCTNTMNYPPSVAVRLEGAPGPAVVGVRMIAMPPLPLSLLLPQKMDMSQVSHNLWEALFIHEVHLCDHKQNTVFCHRGFLQIKWHILTCDDLVAPCRD